jgi:uncharacterized protein (DUF427 family)
MVARSPTGHQPGSAEEDDLDPPGPDVLRARRKWKHDGSERPPWAESPAAGQQSVWDFPRPPRIEAELRTVRVEHRGVLVAESRDALRIVETAGAPAFYLPVADVDESLLASVETVSFCEWKGRARHFRLQVAGDVVREAAWSYPDPFPEFEAIRDRFAFHPARIDGCWLGDAKATAQPGGYYGGWVTQDLSGPIKGGPGSGSW